MASEGKCFTIIWKLENVNYCLVGKDVAINRPEFVVDSINEAKWHLRLFLRGKDDERYIAFCILRDEDSKEAFPKEIKVELAFVDSNGSVLSSEEFNYDFFEDEGYGCWKIAEREDLLNTTQDILTARCRIWKIDEEMTENVRCFARTRIGVEKRSFLWNVKKFSTIELEEKHTYELKSVDHDKQLLSINLSLADGLRCEKVIRFELVRKDQDILFFSVQLSLIDASRNRINCHRDEIWFHNESTTKEFKFCFTKNQLMVMKKSYLPEDILSLHWEFAFSKGIVFNEIEAFQNACTISDFKNSYAQSKNIETMTLDSYTFNETLKSIYEENFLCDVKLKTRTRTFNAHKVILGASSSVFKQMFSNDMTEKGSNIVHIKDFSDHTINQMLHFMYSRRVGDLTPEMAVQLYVAADKYAVLSLKNICCSYIKNNLSPITACEVLKLSDLHADSDLKSTVQGYIIQNGKLIINSEEWEALMQNNSKLAAETLCLQFK